MLTTVRSRVAVPHATSVDDVLELLHSARRYTAGEDLSVLEHSLQTADILRQAFSDDVELQIAGLLHDIDHVIGCHPSLHGDVAVAFLADLFPKPVTEMIRLHVPAKRFLIARDPTYRDRLTSASEATLRSQGEAMAIDEIELFQAEPLARRATALRRADEQAKSSSVRTSSLDAWREPLRALAALRAETVQC
jgi:predicted HD phosphohydrolase